MLASFFTLVAGVAARLAPSEPLSIQLSTRRQLADSCTGKSATLPPAECAAWISLFDTTKGATWTFCSANRLDPCDCSYVSGGGNRGVTCSAWGGGIHITMAQLPSNNLRGRLPDSISALSGLTFLFLGSNQIGGSIPDLSRMSGLTFLALGGNQIEGTIPAALAGLERLGFLALDSNRLTGAVPNLPFKNYNNAVSCCLQSGGDTPSNHYTCPLPPDSALCTGPEDRPPRCSCTGSSASLSQSECEWWINLFDTTGGSTQWSNCQSERTDPCACSYSFSASDGYGVYCTGEHITKL